MRKLLAIFIVILLIASVSALTVFTRPKSNTGTIFNGGTFNYVFNFTSDEQCNDIILSRTVDVTLDRYGIGSTELDISALNSSVPLFLCEFRSNVLRATHTFQDDIFRDVYLRNLVVSGTVNASSWLNISITESQITDLNHTISNQQLNTTSNVEFANLTLTDQITFRLGELIDNIEDAWIRITGNLNVTNHATIGGNLNVTHNLTVSDRIVVEDKTDFINAINLTEANITDLVHTTDTTIQNASACPDLTYLDGNGNCISISDFNTTGGDSNASACPSGQILTGGGLCTDNATFFSVGIGTTSPTQKLDVNGSIKSSDTYLFFDGSTQTTPGEANVHSWFISSASFKQNFSVSSIETSPQDVFFKPDGLKMYVPGVGSGNVSEFNLTTAWDVSTATFKQGFTATTASPLGMFFRIDGKKLYLASNSGGVADVVDEYDLTTAWDVSTATQKQAFTPSESVNTNGIFFKPDGLSMYVTSNTGPDDEINEYTLSTPWDISTSSFTQVFSLSDNPTETYFKPDGTRMYVVGSNTNNVQEYILSTPWNISTASSNKVFNASEDGVNRGIFFKSDGTKMYIAGNNFDSVFEYNLGFIIEEGNVGIGTTTPSTVLEVNGTLNVTGNSDFANITLTDRIIFRLAEFIDNLEDAWLRITGNLNVTGHGVIGGNFNVTHNVTIGGNLTILGLPGCSGDIETDAGGNLICGTDVDTTIQNASGCPSGEYLDGSGDCIPITDFNNTNCNSTGSCVSGGVFYLNHSNNGNFTLNGNITLTGDTDMRLSNNGSCFVIESKTSTVNIC